MKTAALLLAFTCGGACGAYRAQQAEATYLGQSLECVDKNETRAEIDACRERVRERWGVDAGAKR